MRSRVLPQVILAIKSLSALVANVSLFARMDDKVQRQLLLPFKGLQANRAHERSFRVVALLVPGQVILSLQGRIANVTNKPPL